MKQVKSSSLLKVLIVLLLLVPFGELFGQSHRYINSVRSSNNNFYFEHEVEGYTGKQIGANDTYNLSGKSINSSFGVEYFGLFQLEAGHNYMDLKSSDNSLYSLEGSSFNAGVSLFFVSPLVNFEVGTGAIISDLEAMNEQGTGKYYGSGLYRTLGLQYFLTTKASLHLNVSEKEQRLTLSTGNDDFSNVRNIDYNGVSFGFKLWL